jgi:hypothetical protein
MTDVYDRMLEMLGEKRTLSEIARVLGKSYSAVAQMRRRLNLRYPDDPRVAPKFYVAPRKRKAEMNGQDGADQLKERAPYGSRLKAFYDRIPPVDGAGRANGSYRPSLHELVQFGEELRRSGKLNVPEFTGPVAEVSYDAAVREAIVADESKRVEIARRYGIPLRLLSDLVAHREGGCRRSSSDVVVDKAVAAAAEFQKAYRRRPSVADLAVILNMSQSWLSFAISKSFAKS